MRDERNDAEQIAGGVFGRIARRKVRHPSRRCEYLNKDPEGLVGARGFEPPTPCSRSKCATRLRYAPPDRQPEKGFPRGRVGTEERGVIATSITYRKRFDPANLGVLYATIPAA